MAGTRKTPVKGRGGVGVSEHDMAAAKGTTAASLCTW